MIRLVGVVLENVGENGVASFLCGLKSGACF